MRHYQKLNLYKFEEVMNKIFQRSNEHNIYKKLSLFLKSSLILNTISV